jgi:putative NIF3 family GTP cyclohydrolase 1 type 2
MHDMDITRRSFLLTGAALATYDFLGAGLSAKEGQPASASLTAGQVIDRIKARVGIPWMAETVDNIVAGTADVRVRGIATTMMATLEVLQKAAAAGKNMVITHEPTFYSHQDTTDTLVKDPTFQVKRDHIAKHDMVVFRFHDHWHRMTPDGIATGMARELGWEKHTDPKNSRRFVFPPTPLGQLVKDMESRLKVRSMRVVGDPGMSVARVAASWGYASLMPGLINVAASPDVDLVVVGETREWELVEYVQDQIAAGQKKALIVLNHVVSEQAGMKYCAEWLKPFITEVPIEFVAASEPFWRP